jgi:hypothetical protein
MRTFFLIALLALLTGCEEDDARTAKLTKPIIVDIGVVEGCSVKFIDRGWRDDSFYIAKCGTTTVQTYQYASGKSHVMQATITDMAAIDEQLKQLQRLQDTKAALEKLSPHEKELLGIK